MKKILLISTGGTISQDIGDDGTTKKSENKGADALKNYILSLKDTYNMDVDIASKTILNKDSSNIISEDWKVLINLINEEYDNYDSFVITHGTNTISYTCAALSFSLTNIGKPVILTGSQISYGYLGSDANINLENAIRVAASDHPRLVGVMAIFGGEIISGVRVKKSNEYGYDVFKTYNAHNIATIGRELTINSTVYNQHISYLRPLATYKRELIVLNDFDMNILSINDFPGLKSDFLMNLVNNNSNIKGIIFRATGAGDPNIALEEAKYDNLREWFIHLQEKKIPIIVTTQVVNGIASMDVNEPGKLAKEFGAIPAYDMNIESTTAKLAWLLAQKFTYEEIKRLMVKPFKGEVNPTNYE